MKPEVARYRIESTRLEGYDYGSNGAYFVTICTANRATYFGSVIETPKQQSEWKSSWNQFEQGLINSMQELVALSPIGKIAKQFWIDIPEHFPWVTLDEFIVMPNHIHGVLLINKHDSTREKVGKPINIKKGSAKELEKVFTETQNVASLLNDNIPEEMQDGISLRRHDGELDFFTGLTGKKNKFGPQSANLSSVIRGYKAAVKAHCSKGGISFGWQPRFYDRVIRDENELHKIREYIFVNPMNWALDKDNTESLLM